MTNLSDPNCPSCPKCYTALKDGVCGECGYSPFGCMAAALSGDHEYSCDCQACRRKPSSLKSYNSSVAGPTDSVIAAGGNVKIDTAPVNSIYWWRGDLRTLETKHCQPGLSCRMLDQQTIELTLTNPRVKFGAAFIENGTLVGHVESYTERTVVMKLGDRANPNGELMPGTGEVTVSVYAIPV